MQEVVLKEEIKKIQLEIVKEIDRICQKHKIRYYLAYGTLIGAIRHNGFIPWDDDIDIMMPYEDMIKFQSISDQEMDKERFFYQSPESEAEYRLTINRVRRNGTVLIEPTLEGKSVHQGIFVDIYPLFVAKEGKISRKLQVIKGMLRALYMLDEPVKNHGLLMKMGSEVILKLKSKKGKERTARKYLEEFRKKNFDESQYVTVLDSGIKEMATTYQREWFGSGKLHAFENTQLMVPEKYEQVLNTYFGDYTVLPPEEERVYHHNYKMVKLLDGTEERF